jgi:F-type H+-transporting ATPase subunit b
VSVIASAQSFAAGFVQAEFDIDEDGYVTAANPILPPVKEIFIGGAASLIVFVLLYKYAWPEIKKAMHGRTERIQTEIDDSAAAKAAAETEADEIREALGDVDAERTRLFAEADEQAAALLDDGRQRLDAEIAELETRAEADIASAATRGSDDLRADMARYSSDAIDAVVESSLDDAAQQNLVEGFIARVGAQSGATS